MFLPKRLHAYPCPIYDFLAEIRKLEFDEKKLIFILLLFSCFMSIPLAFVNNLDAQIAFGKCKFMGNIIAGSVPFTFTTYWNQVTPKNSGKWGSVEVTQSTIKGSFF